MVDYLPDYFLLVSIIYNVKELEVFTYHLPIKMALANFICQVCILWLNVIDGRGENCNVSLLQYSRE